MKTFILIKKNSGLPSSMFVCRHQSNFQKFASEKGFVIFNCSLDQRVLDRLSEIIFLKDILGICCYSKLFIVISIHH